MLVHETLSNCLKQVDILMENFLQSECVGDNVVPENSKGHLCERCDY